MSTETYDGEQAFADDDEDRIVGLDMPWYYAGPNPDYSTRRVWKREAKYELRHRRDLIIPENDGS